MKAGNEETCILSLQKHSECWRTHCPLSVTSNLPVTR